MDLWGFQSYESKIAFLTSETTDLQNWRPVAMSRNAMTMVAATKSEDAALK
jgi:hypothetical protein